MGVNKVFQNGYLRREGAAALEGVAGVAARAGADGLVVPHHALGPLAADAGDLGAGGEGVRGGGEGRW